MLKKGVLFILLLASFILSLFTGTNLRQAHTQSSSSVNDTLVPIAIDTLRKIPNNSFKGGEFLKFDVNYGFVTAGEAVLRIRDTLYNERKCYFVEFTLNSKPFFDVFYKVRDRYSTMIDSEGLFPWRFEQHVREGGYKRDFFAEFDQRRHIATTTDGEYGIPPYVQDIMSAFYFTRTVDFSDYRPGEKILLQNFYKDSTYSLDVRFKGRESVEVEAGRFRCIVVEPLVREGGLFKSEGRIFVWLTDDERRMPVKVKANIIIGSVESELTAYSGLEGPLKSKIK